MLIKDEILDKYFKFLYSLDISVKKSLIIRLTNSIETEPDKKSKDFYKLFGAWNDRRTAEDIISDIRNARTINRKIDNF